MVSDSGGLFMLVTRTGSKLWRYAYNFDSKQKLLALGQYPVTSLADAGKPTRQIQFHSTSDPQHEHIVIHGSRNNLAPGIREVCEHARLPPSI